MRILYAIRRIRIIMTRKIQKKKKKKKKEKKGQKKKRRPFRKCSCIIPGRGSGSL